MDTAYKPIIGLEVHAELQTRSKMFCSCPVVDFTKALPNVAVCPVCAGMPGVLPVINRQAVEYALLVAIALDCEIQETSIFERKNYFYPDLPKGYQISQYAYPLARNGYMAVLMPEGEKSVRIRRVHIEEDTGRLTHINQEDGSYSLVDINRAGVPLLEIVSEPDLHSVAEVRAYAASLRSLLRYLGVNSGDMEKGLLRIEPNVSVRPLEQEQLGTRVEIKNLNSFRALERAVTYEIQRQIEVLRQGGVVNQETVGWDESEEVTFAQRTKEAEDDYRYFPEPDLPPLVVNQAWIDRLRAALPELPAAKLTRFQKLYGLNLYDAEILITERAVADYFESVVAAGGDIAPKVLANWVTGELFGLMNQAGQSVEDVQISPQSLAELIDLVDRGEINKNTGKTVLAEMYKTGESALRIVENRGLRQISDVQIIVGYIAQVLEQNPEQVETYLGGKTTVAGWLFGQVMRMAGGKANPKIVQDELERQLRDLTRSH
jgi:aspartyl-tRNA(Asn)/glutamyl-tRNA(Gln) amidotransferase subunit B